jgi:hypothetical protein
VSAQTAGPRRNHGPHFHAGAVAVFEQADQRPDLFEDGLSVHLSYKAEAAEDVERMVRQEQCCCGFLTFDLSRGPDSVEVVITAPANAGDDARALYANLLPDEASPVR